MQVPILEIPASRSDTPPSAVYWNDEVTGKFENNLWCSITYGQKLEKQRVSSPPEFGRMHLAPLDGFASGLWITG